MLFILCATISNTHKFYYQLVERWIEGIEGDMQIMVIRQWRKKCKERAEWKSITEKAKTHSGL
jgi:hypothetical protein